MDAVDFATICVLVSGLAAGFLALTLVLSTFKAFDGSPPPEGWREVTFALFTVAATGALLAIAILQVDGARNARDLFG